MLTSWIYSKRGQHVEFWATEYVKIAGLGRKLLAGGAVLGAGALGADQLGMFDAVESADSPVETPKTETPKTETPKTETPKPVSVAGTSVQGKLNKTFDMFDSMSNNSSIDVSSDNGNIRISRTGGS